MIGPRQMLSGELHYPRIPREYWRHRLSMARAMGLHAVSTYVFWNVHEEREGTYRFDGYRDLAAFLRIAQEEGLQVVLRPGPYVCAEWDFGGLPAWMLTRPMRVRSADPAFMQPVRRWLDRLGEELAPLHRRAGGPIVAVQLENEYGAFGSDKAYLRELRGALVDSGFGDLPAYTIDQPDDVERGSLEGVAAAVTFAPGDAGSQFEQLRVLRPAQRPVCGEYWAGWFDHWGEPRAQLDAALQEADLQWMLANGVSVNIYMLHGGTNFALWNGANAFDPHPYQPTVTSYDYQAAIDESGRVTPKYLRFREIVAAHTGETLPAVPAAPPAATVSPFRLDRVWPLEAALQHPKRAREAQTMEMLGVSRGFILYRTKIDRACEGPLDVNARDYAVVMVDGRRAGVIDRRVPAAPLHVSCAEGATLELLVENMGRINYGAAFPGEWKGVAGCVRIGGTELCEWEMFALTAHAPELRGDRAATPRAPCFYAGSFDLGEPGDVFFDMRGLGNGVLWVNGRCAGRYRTEGPQHHLYVPAPWLRLGTNEALVLELETLPGIPFLQGGSRVA